jgi:hypothetical protein
MWVIKVSRDPLYQSAILNAVISFEMKVQEIIDAYFKRLDGAYVIETERVETLDLNDGEYE